MGGHGQVTEKDCSLCELADKECTNSAGATDESEDTDLKPKGPGHHLRSLLSHLGIDSAHKGCQCKNRAAKMDRKGNDWCRKNINTILLWLHREAKKRKLPFSKAIAKQIVLIAIRRSEREGYKPKQ